MQLQRSVQTPAAPDAVFAYLSDFTNTTAWDPGTVSTERVEGDGGVGTVYHNVSEFSGRKTELQYTVIEHEAPARFVLRGENKSVTALDSMVIEADGEGSRVTYTADFQFKGLARLAAPFMDGAFKKLGDEAEEGLREALGKL